MIEIPLTKGLVAMIDDDDLPLVSGRKWHAMTNRHMNYAQATSAHNHVRSYHKMHRVILAAPAGTLVDHIDRNGLNNTRANLRLSTPSQNAANMVKYEGISKYKGVQPSRYGWQAAVTVNYKRKYLGYFDSEIDAAMAYDRAASAEFGPFARLNFPKLLTPAAPVEPAAPESNTELRQVTE